MARKAILAYCAERANDDGSGVWASKARIAKEVECSKQTVIAVIKSLQNDGLLREVGHKKTPNGYVVEYAISLPSISLLPEAVEDVYAIVEGEGSNSGPVKPVDPTSQATRPHQSNELTPPVKPVDPNRPLTVQEPSKNHAPAGEDLFGEVEDPQNKAPDVSGRFWEIYPKCSRKTDRIGVMDLFRKIATGKHRKHPKTDPQLIVAAVERYAASKPDPQYIPAPSRWLNEGRWENWPEPPKPTDDRPRRRVDPPFWEEVVR